MHSSWRCVLIGEESLLIQCARTLQARGHEIAAVVSQRTAIRDWASETGIVLIDRPNDLPTAGVEPFDYLFSVTNLSVLSGEVLRLPGKGAINFHDGPLPHYAGLNVPVWALLNREPLHGITWHQMTGKFDAGEVLTARGIAIEEGETAFSLNTKCFAAAIESFEELVDGLGNGRIVPQAQPHGPARYFSRRHRPEAACAIQWNQPAETIDALVRALDFGGYANPIGKAKASIAGKLMLVQATGIEASDSCLAPGTILEIQPDRIVVATIGRDIALRRFATLEGVDLTPGEAASRFGLAEGTKFDPLSPQMLSALSEINSAMAAHEDYWRGRIASLGPVDLPLVARDRHPGRDIMAHAELVMPGPDVLGRDKAVLAATVALIARLCDKAMFDIGYTDPVMTASHEGLEAWFSPQVPVRADVDFAAGMASLQEKIAADVREVHRRLGFAADLVARMPEMKGQEGPLLPVSVLITERLEDVRPLPGSDLTIAIRSDGKATGWFHDPERLDALAIESMQQGLLALLRASDEEPQHPVGELPLLSSVEQLHAMRTWSGPDAPWRAEACVHELFAEQARRAPERIAATCRGENLSYGELDRRSNQLARHLQGLGVGPDQLVGLFVERSLEMLVALIAIQKAGGAYVPLDPKYPAERIAHMVSDSRAKVIVTQAHLAGGLVEQGAALVRIDADWPAIMHHSADPVESGAGPASLAYVIYTSGSTGKPKGVMVEHRNVANFFAGMDQQITPQGSWLAVTSLSFDISVLELSWTLCRGMHVVLAAGGELTDAAAPARRPLDFSLFYFAADAESEPGEKYRLLLDGAKFADQNGFCAVWTPERHFHAFGGLYPNPAVTGAAVAAVTSRVEIRGGSVVVPLHHPARVAEEWSVVDNLSNGRAGIAFASGWQPNDFVLRPESFADRSGALIEGMEAVRALWRGESRSFAGPLGKPVDVKILPRPVQAELPFWITSAGNMETFAAAGRAGAGILTHLLGQTLEELSQKLAAYRSARREAGHAGDGHVTLMLHSFAGPDAEKVRETVREPMIAYLRTATSLVKQYAWAFPAFKRRPGMNELAGQDALEALSPADMETLLSFAFDRYYETSGLFGTPESCMAMVEQVRAAGVDEIACLIDFGVAADTVLAHLPYLNEVRLKASAGQRARSEEPLPALMERHDVTHLQCTPSMMRLLLADPDARKPIAALKHLMIGGEAFPPDLARELSGLASGTVTNMYGPTETTIWSATHVLDGAEGAVPLGKPLANQHVYILDSRQQPLPPGVPGEIVIGGHGVVRGYLDRPSLTAERFIADPLRPGERAYRTGDLGRRRADGALEFLGRLDHQVKVRGYRIELGEIEAALASHAQVHEAVVVAREDEAGDKQLIAFVAPELAPELVTNVRETLKARLPDFMVPAHLIPLALLPKTPNGKIDRNALPPLEPVAIASTTENFVAPAGGMEERIAAIWCDVLKLSQVGTRDNFFDLGGHSLLAVQMHRRLRTELRRELPITDIFRFPTVQSLSAHLSGADSGGKAAEEGQSRAEGRRAALQRRIAGRVPVALGEGR